MGGLLNTAAAHAKPCAGEPVQDLRCEWRLAHRRHAWLQDGAQRSQSYRAKRRGSTLAGATGCGGGASLSSLLLLSLLEVSALAFLPVAFFLPALCTSVKSIRHANDKTALAWRACSCA